MQVSQAAYAVNPDAVLFFQLYVQRKRDITVQMVKRAEKCGFRALVLTVDVPVMGRYAHAPCADMCESTWMSSCTLGSFASATHWKLLSLIFAADESEI